MCTWCWKGENGPPSPLVLQKSMPLNADAIEHKEPNMGNVHSKYGETREKVRELHAQGLATRAIADELGLKPVTVLYHISKLNLKPNPREATPAVNSSPAHSKPVRRGGSRAAQTLPAPGEVATLRLTEANLDAIWSRLPINDKARLIERL
jgi:hypothetical protein